MLEIGNNSFMITFDDETFLLPLLIGKPFHAGCSIKAALGTSCDILSVYIEKEIIFILLFLN